MVAEVLRVLVALAVVGLLGRAARPAWRNRTLAVTVWRRIRPRHVLGCLALLALVLSVAVGLLVAVPPTRLGLGSLIGLSGNAVFAPVLETAARGGEPGAGDASATLTAGDVLLVGGIVAFLCALLALLPWLAYVEERVFREGLEEADTARQVWVATKFGLAHLVMLIPLGAAAAVGVAGFVYGRIYRAAFQRALNRAPAWDSGPFGVLLPVSSARRVAEARDRAVFDTTVWHTTFNSMIVVIVLTGLLVDLLG